MRRGVDVAEGLGRSVARLAVPAQVKVLQEGGKKEGQGSRRMALKSIGGLGEEADKVYLPVGLYAIAESQRRKARDAPRTRSTSSARR
jgi:hypothetical protein